MNAHLHHAQPPANPLSPTGLVSNALNHTAPTRNAPSMGATSIVRRLPIGAEVQAAGGVHFRVWAPKRRVVELVCHLAGHANEHDASWRTTMLPEADGYFSVWDDRATAGTLYSFRLDGGEKLYPDPASRFQPDGPEGPSQVVDPAAWTWTDNDWPGVSLRGQVIYEMHIGTFTPEGTWHAAACQLPELAATGITVIEVMPVADFSGQFGWGYDGVNMFAPSRLYGNPDDFRHFVACAHSHGIAVILDVVYNHFGPNGNYLPEFSSDYFTDKYSNEWGEAINFDGENAASVREFFIANAGYWIDEFHLDGLRLDATQQIFDESPDHILAAISRKARQAAGARDIILVAENERQDTRLVAPPEKGGFDIDGIWNDDYHHSAVVALTGHSEAYYSDHAGKPQEFLSAIKWGFLYQGQYYSWQKARRGTPSLHLPPEAFITFMENHDQVANSVNGLRTSAKSSPGRHRAMTALLLLGPNTPMLFQGQEFAASSPFLYFADHEPKLAECVRAGRRLFLEQFPSLADPAAQHELADPAAISTFERCKLNFSERTKHAPIYAMHRDLLRLRREDAVISKPRPRAVDGSVLSESALLLRFLAEDGDDRLLFVNFGRDTHLHIAPEPLLAPPAGKTWQVIWSSEDPRYGGAGTPPMEREDGWHILGEAAVVMAPRPADAHD